MIILILLDLFGPVHLNVADRADNLQVVSENLDIDRVHGLHLQGTVECGPDHHSDHKYGNDGDEQDLYQVNSLIWTLRTLELRACLPIIDALSAQNPCVTFVAQANGFRAVSTKAHSRIGAGHEVL